MSGPASESLLAGSKFGVYEVGECIGRGAMGQVYRAEHRLLKRPVALKIMATAARNSTTGHRRFTREARAAATIKHPNVVDILDMGVLDGLPFIVMELLEGEDLESYLARHGRLGDRQIADLALPIIAAIGAVHDAGVVHRDIKPSNIFLAKGTEEDLVPKVLDFGISKTAKPLGDSEFVATGPGDLVGTPLYISPEALKGAQYLTTRSDQYSLAVVLYQCAAGRRPHEAKDLARLVRSILSDPVEPLRSLDPGISPELESAVMRALSRNPEDRFEHVRDLGAALWSLASQRTRHVWAKRFSTSLAYTLPFGAQSAPVALPRPRRRELRPLWVGLAAAGVVLGAGYIVSIARPPTGARPPLASAAVTLDRAQAAIQPRAVGSTPSPSTAPVASSTHVPTPAAAEPRDTPTVAPVPPEPVAASVASSTGTAVVRPVARREPPRSSPEPRRGPPSVAVAKPAPARATGGGSEGRVSPERRTPSTGQDEASLLQRSRQLPAEGRRTESPAQPPRGANQSPILD